MKYVTFIGTDGPQPPEAVAEMNRDWPAWAAEVERRGVRTCGRELDLPDTAVTVRVHDGETLVTDGPFAETKEFVGGVNIVDCADLDEVVDFQGTSPVARFLPFEIRPARGELRAVQDLTAFEQGDDSAGIPYLLMCWVVDPTAEPGDASALQQRVDAWRDEQLARGSFVLGSELGGPETATTMRHRNGETTLSDGSFLGLDEFIASIDVVRCQSPSEAADVAAGHPLAQTHPIEVRPFYSVLNHPEGEPSA